jgi:hypothetical protein
VSDAISKAIEAMEQVAEVLADMRADEPLREAIAGLQALQSGEPVAVADRGVLNWIDGKQFNREADLYTTPQSHDWYPISRGFYHYLYKCKNCNAVAIDFPEEHIPILCGTTKV